MFSLYFIRGKITGIILSPRAGHPVSTSSVLGGIVAFTPFCRGLIASCQTSLCVGNAVSVGQGGFVLQCMPSVFHLRGNMQRCVIRACDSLRFATPGVCSRGIGTSVNAIRGDQKMPKVLRCFGVGLCSSALLCSQLLSPLTGGKQGCCGCLVSSMVNKASGQRCGVQFVPEDGDSRLINKCVVIDDSI